MSRPYSVLDVSRYVINYCDERKNTISNLKLQKILYFIQAYFLISSDEGPCFYERIEAWDFGPVVPEAYHEFKSYGSSSIPKIKSYFVFDEKNIWNTKRVPYDDSVICESDKKLIREVVDLFTDYSATDLVTLTHKQAPWKMAYVRNQNNEITIESIRRYFSE